MKPYRVNNRGQAWYGESIGILILDASYPCIPGNVGNANTFDFPVRYEKIEGASIDRLLNQLECSDLPPYAAAVQGAVNLPVFDFTTMINYIHSSLVRMPFKGFM